MNNDTLEKDFLKNINSLNGNIDISNTKDIDKGSLLTFLKNAGISSIVMAGTGEILEISPEKPLAAVKKTQKKAPTHKNQLGYIDPTVAGIDIGDKVIHVAIPDANGEVRVKESGTTTPDLHKIVQELKQAGVKTAVMEATGVYWTPLFEIAEEYGLKSILVDAKSAKNVPGRKSDVLDCQWIQTLYSNGMLNAAFRPPKDRVALRSYVRQRLNNVKLRQRSLEHLEKALQLMNIKLSTALSDIGGISGMNIIRAIVAGERNPAELARLRSYRCKKPNEMFEAALTGNFQEEHLFALKQALNVYDFANGLLEECDKKIEAELKTYQTVTKEPPPQRDKDKRANGNYATMYKPKKNDLTFDARTLLWEKSGVDFTVLSGVQASTALLIFAELGGIDMSPWRSVKAFSSWLKLCPGNNISGGKRRKSKKQPCANYITQALRMASLSAKHSKSALGAHIRRITGRTDKPKGIKAGAHKIAHMLYYMCKEGWQYYEKGEDYYERMYAERILKNLHKKAKEYGYTLVPTTEEKKKLNKLG